MTFANQDLTPYKSISAFKKKHTRTVIREGASKKKSLFFNFLHVLVLGARTKQM